MSPLNQAVALRMVGGGGVHPGTKHLHAVGEGMAGDLETLLVAHAIT